MPIATFVLVALDCPDPQALASFYQQRDPAYHAPGWPGGAAQQAHLDFDVPDLDAGERSVLALGAVKAASQPTPDEWRVFLDPAGHPFCLCLIPS